MKSKGQKQWWVIVVAVLISFAHYDENEKTAKNSYVELSTAVLWQKHPFIKKSDPQPEPPPPEVPV